MAVWKRLQNWIGIRKGKSADVFVLQLPSGRKVELKPGVQFTSRDLPGLLPHASGTAVAQVSTHPQNPSILGLQNLSKATWLSSQQRGDQSRVDPGRSVKLIDGTKVNFGHATATIQFSAQNQPAQPVRVNPGIASVASKSPSPPPVRNAGQQAKRNLAFETPRRRSRQMWVWVTLAVCPLIAAFSWGTFSQWQFLNSDGLSKSADSNSNPSSPVVEFAKVLPEVPIEGSELRIQIRLTGGGPYERIQYSYRVGSRQEWQPARDGRIRLVDLKAGSLHIEARASSKDAIEIPAITKTWKVLSINECADPAALIAAGQLQLQAHRWELAKMVFTRAIDVATNPVLRAASLVGRGRAHAGRRRFDKAIDDFSEALVIVPGFGPAYSCRGLAHLETCNDSLAAIDLRQAAIVIEPRTAEDYFFRGQARSALSGLSPERNYDLAMADFSKVIQLNGEDPDILLARGHVYDQQREYDLAIADYTSALRIVPERTDLYLNRGWSSVSKFDYQRALGDFQELVKLIHCDDAIEYFERGSARYGLTRYSYDTKPDYESAINDLSGALDRDAKFQRCWRLRGQAYFEAGDTKKATSDFDEAIRLLPTDDLALELRGNLADLDRAIELNPKSAQHFRQRALKRRNAKRKEESIADNEEAIRLLGGQRAWDCTLRAFMLNELGAVLQKSPLHLERAIAECGTAIELAPTIPTAYEERGWAYWKKKEFDRAIADLTRAIRLDPHNSACYNYRASVYEEMGNKEAAEEDRKKAKELKQ